MWGGLPDVFLKFEFHDDRSINVGAMGVEMCLFPSLIQQLFATAQAVIKAGASEIH